MEMDLDSTDYEQIEYETYILGSAEVVGLMCLQVFVEGDTKEFERLKYNAMKLGSAFQKINFLRDLQADYNELGRAYFPGFDINTFDDATKKEIEKDISLDFSLGYEGIIQLPKKARLGVYLAYVYYFKLFNKIKNSSPETLMNKRIRIPNNKKFRLLLSSFVRHNLNSL
jgi:phytoene/squalene synthetase